uniref:Protein-glucosylgalactosylhydroxylysine glucosidase n=1 Tax=Anopheles culicifacies TaxID=139723 RepID=A0A182MI62_9DIPT
MVLRLRVLICLVISVLGAFVLGQGDTSDENYKFQTRAPLPDAAVMPTLANGNIGLVAYGAFVHLNGVYNGLGGKSHRARIPNYGNIQLMTCSPESNNVSPSCTYQLDMKSGKFVTVDESTAYRVVHEMYPHRYYDTVLVNRVRIQRLGSVAVIQARLMQIPAQSEDFTWSPNSEFVMSGQVYQVRCGTTVQVEEPNVQAFGHNVCVTYPTIPEYVQIEPDVMAKEFQFYTAFTTTETDGRRQIEAASGNVQEETFHMREMQKLWDRYGITAEGNRELDRVIKASAFYLFSSLPSHQVASSVGRYPFYGLAPAGLGRGGVVEQEYQGHSFWDTEIWMYPSILLVDPINAARVLSYRNTVSGGARMNALRNTYQGIQFPWESAFTGTEVTPDCCPEVVNYQHHITADIVFAMRQYFYATGDLEWLRSQACRIAADTSLFWLSRVVYNNATDLYEIRGAMGPDEDHPNVSNNAFTNVMAAHNLFFGEFASCYCRDDVVDEDVRKELLKVGKGLTLLYDAEGDFHPQFEGYQTGTPIKQADTVLLIYPLQYPMNESTKANNLLKYSQVTRENGPAMTWAIHTIGHLELNQLQEAGAMFDKSYRQYLRAPFNVWSENGNNEPGAGNFITGAGGFLQSIINGYAGIRLHQDRLEIKNTRVTPLTDALHLPTIEYRGVQFSLTVRPAGFTIKIKTKGQTDLKLLVDQNERPICDNCEYNGTVASIEVTMNQTFEGCRLKPTILGVKVADQTDAASVLVRLHKSVLNTFKPAQENVIFYQCKMWFLTLFAFGLSFLTVHGNDYNFLFNATKLPNKAVTPTLANGHLGFVVYGDSVHLNGVYNGLKGVSHRARIPNVANIQLANCSSLQTQPKNCRYQLDMKYGKFRTTLEDPAGGYKVQHEVYPNRHFDQTIVNRIHIRRLNSKQQLQIETRQLMGSRSVDVQEAPLENLNVDGDVYLLMCARTKQVEDPKYQREGHQVCIAYKQIPRTLTLAPEETDREFIYLSVFAHSRQEIETELRGLKNNDHERMHRLEMDRMWRKYGIRVEGNDRLDRVIKASAFYLSSSLPSQSTFQPGSYPFYGLSPSGLGRGGKELAEYQGHSFWDTEMWMFPPILLLDPLNARKLLHYRTLVTDVAADNARANGYEGWQYAWESAYTGREVTPDFCPQVPEYQHHITADVAYAARLYYYATGDLDWLRTDACRLAYETARFWKSRVDYNAETDTFDIGRIMGPDEDHHNVTNSIYTNVIAAHNLFFGAFVGCHCRASLPDATEEEFAEFLRVAKSITLPYNAQYDVHPEYKEYTFGTQIKQADVVLLGYPLEFPMKESTKANNLRLYSMVTRPDGPAMTWAIHTIGHLDLNELDHAAAMFRKSYKQYLRAPFHVWSENGDGADGAGNFITGAGGFLQSLINGYAGVRLRHGKLIINKPRLPPGTTRLFIPQLNFGGVQFALDIGQNSFRVTFETGTQEAYEVLSLLVDDLERDLFEGCEYTGSKSAILLMRQTRDNTATTCTLHDTVLGMRLADQDGRLFTTTQLIAMSLVIGLLGVLYSIYVALRSKRARGKPFDWANFSAPATLSATSGSSSRIATSSTFSSRLSSCSCSVLTEFQVPLCCAL